MSDITDRPVIALEAFDYWGYPWGSAKLFPGGWEIHVRNGMRHWTNGTVSDAAKILRDFGAHTITEKREAETA